MDSKIILCVLLIGAIMIAGCSSSGGSYNAPPTGGAVSGGGGCGRFADQNAECVIVEEEIAVEAAPQF